MKKEIDTLTEKVIGAAMAVHRALGAGYVESVYQKALAFELTSLGIAFVEQAAISVEYRGHIVGDFVADFLVEGVVMVELKAVQTLLPAHEVQIVNYLTSTGVENGLLINFGSQSLDFRRKFKSPKNPVDLVNPVKTSEAFTILELLVAMAVMALLLVLLLNMVNSATKLWRENENRVDSYREARAAIGIISRDLQNALTGSTNTNHFLVNASAFQKISTIGGVVTNTNSGSAVFALSALPAKAQEPGVNKSDVCQVGYFVAYNRTVASANQSLNLYRYFRSSDSTFTNLIGDTLFNDATIGASGAELLARNITGFTVRPLDLVVSTSTNSGTVTTNTSFVPFTPTPANRLPNVVEVSITAVNQDASKRLNSQADWTSTSGATYSNIIAPVQQTFTTRIRLNKP